MENTQTFYPQNDALMVTKYKLTHWVSGPIRKYPPFLAIFLLTIWLLPGITACEKEPDPMIIRIMSYNIAAGYGDIGAVADVIRRYEPDIAVYFDDAIIHFYNTHLDYRPDPAVREAQVMPVTSARASKRYEIDFQPLSDQHVSDQRPE